VRVVDDDQQRHLLRRVGQQVQCAEEGQKTVAFPVRLAQRGAQRGPLWPWQRVEAGAQWPQQPL